ncbi:PorV/PorQ family protein [bacterium]|nr:PorV/PorQ family protein [bacterium]
MRRTITGYLMIGIAFLHIVSDAGIVAGTKKRKGTAGAMELILPVGCCGTAMGGNYTAGISGVEALFWNPAGMAATDRTSELMASRMNYIADIDVNYIAVQGSFSSAGVFGLSLKSLDFGDIPVTTEYAPDGTGETYSPAYVTMGLSFSRAMTDRINIGVTGKLVSEKIMNTSATGMAFDFGVQYQSDIGLQIGVALRNLGTRMRFDGTDLEKRVYLPTYTEDPIAGKEALRIVSQPVEFPTTMDIGLSYTFEPSEGHQCTGMVNFRDNHFGFDQYGAGLEYQYSMPAFRIAVRTGGSVAHDVEDNCYRIMDDEMIYGPSFGGGIYLKMGENLHLSIDYACQMAKRFSDPEWISLIFKF